MKKTFYERMKEIKRALLIQALIECSVNVSEAARQLGIHRNTLDRMIEELDINMSQLRKNFSSAGVIAEMSGTERTRKELLAQYSNTYCSGRIPGGVVGTTIGCGAAIPLGTTLCDSCKQRLEEQKKEPAS